MRTVPAGVTAALTKERTVNARATFRRMHLEFEELSVPNALLVDAFDAEGSTSYSFAASGRDSSNYGDGFVRVAEVNYNGYLSEPTGYRVVWQVVGDPEGTWPKWRIETGTSYTVSTAGWSWPAVRGNRIWWGNGDSDGIYWADVTASTFTYGGEITGVNGYVIIAPVSATEIYYIEVDTGTLVYATTTGTKREFPGYIRTGLTWDGAGFDAVRIDGRDYIYHANDYVSYAHVVSATAGQDWSNIGSLTRMDIIDDILKIGACSATVIDGRVFSGYYSVRADKRFWTMHVGLEEFSFDRDMIVVDGANDLSMGSKGFKLHVEGNYIYAVGLGYVMRSDATNLVGVDQSSLRLETPSINNISLGAERNASMRLGFEIDNSLASHTAVSRRCEVMLEMGYDGEYAEMGRFIIDNVSSPKDAVDGKVGVLARSSAVKKLSDWVADAYFDIWSQTKQNSENTELIRGGLVHYEGGWDDNISENFETTSLNECSILYSPKMSSRNMLVRGTFDKISTDSYPTYGLLLRYRVEGTASSSEEDSGTIVEIVESVSATTLNVYTVWLGVRHLEDTAVISNFSDGTVLVQALWQDGLLMVWMREGTTATWTEVYNERVQSMYTDFLPDAGSGHAGILGEVVTNHANGLRFSSTSPNIPVDDNSVFSTPCIIRVHNEKISVDDKSGNWTLTYDGEDMLLNAVEGFTLQGATHWSGTIGSGDEHDFDGHEIYLSNEDVPDAMDTGWVDYFGGCALVCIEGPGIGNAHKVTGFDPEAPYQWVPTGTYTLPDTWMDHVGDLSYGSWDQDDTMIRVFVEAERSVRASEGSVWKIVPALYADERGYDDTTITTHGEQTVSIDTDDILEIEKFEYYSTNFDYTLVDVVKILCAKAGVHDVDADIRRFAEGTSFLFLEPIQSPDMIWELEDMGGAATIVANMVTSMFTRINMQPTFITINVEEGSGDVTKERIDWTQPATGKVRISLIDGVWSIWSNGALIYVSDKYAYPLTDNGGDIRVAMSDATSSTTLTWYSADTRVDNFSLDMGQRGAQMMDRLVNEKFIVWGDTSEGGMRFRRRRDAVTGNTALAPYDLVLSSRCDDDDSGIVTRLVIESINTHEYIYDDWEESGNLFQLVNVMELETEKDIAEMAEIYFAEANRTHASIEGAADPRIEPGDIYYIDIDGVVKEMYVQSVSIKYIVDVGGVIFDMRLEGNTIDA